VSLKQWNIIHSLLTGIGIGFFFLLDSLWPLMILSALSVILLWTTQYYTIRHLKPAGGYANMVTLFRYLLNLVIVALVPYWPLWSIGLFFMVSAMFDGLDGYFARRYDHVTKFGAMFDMETDALFMALSGSILYQKGMAGMWLLPAIYLRYFYVLFIALLGLHHYQERRTRIGPVIAFVMFVALIARFIYPGKATKIVLMAATALIVVSFVYSFLGLLASKENEK
jgi:phosphatidylglycerophosphate synthase